jgi:hypothetical protein
MKRRQLTSFLCLLMIGVASPAYTVDPLSGELTYKPASSSMYRARREKEHPKLSAKTEYELQQRWQRALLKNSRGARAKAAAGAPKCILSFYDSMR